MSRTMSLFIAFALLVATAMAADSCSDIQKDYHRSVNWEKTGRTSPCLTWADAAWPATCCGCISLATIGFMVFQNQSKVGPAADESSAAHVDDNDDHDNVDEASKKQKEVEVIVVADADADAVEKASEGSLENGLSADGAQLAPPAPVTSASTPASSGMTSPQQVLSQSEVVVAPMSASASPRTNPQQQNSVFEQ